MTRLKTYSLVSVGFITGALLWLPASLLDMGAGYWRDAPGRPTEFAGSVWRGSARIILSQPSSNTTAPYLPGRLHWHIGIAGWLPYAQFNLDCCMATPLRVTLSRKGPGSAFSLTGLNLQVPADWLGSLGAPFNTLRPQGQLSVESEQLLLEFGPEGLHTRGSAKLDLNNFTSALSTIQPLGSYRLSFDAQGPTTNITLTTSMGALKLSGTGVLSNGRLQFRGQASSDPKHQNALNNLLNIIGKRQGSNSIISIG